MDPENTTINSRFLVILDQLDLSGYAIGKDGPVSASTITNIRNNVQKPSIELVLWLITTYPQINLDYLMRGEGSPLGRIGTLIYNQGTNNVYNYKSKTKSGAGARELEQLQMIIDGLQRENALLQQLVSVYQTTGGGPNQTER